MKSLNPENPVQDKETMSEWKEYKLGELVKLLLVLHLKVMNMSQVAT